MDVKYRFSINGRTVHPIYKDINKEYQKESGQMFFRESLSGKLKFVRDDYTWLDGQDFETDFVLLVEESLDFGKTWGKFFTGRFNKTDCVWNIDDQYCEVQPDVYDDYNDVIAGLDKEYNLIKLTPEITKLTIKKRPLIQIYQPGQSVVSCFLGGTYWEQDAEEVSDIDEIQNTYYFTQIKPLIELEMNTGASYDGYYSGEMSDGNVLDGDNEQYQCVYFQETQEVGSTGVKVTKLGLRITAIGDETDVKFEWSQTGGIIKNGYKEFKNKVTGGVSLNGYVRDLSIYGRYLLDVEEIQGLTTHVLPTSDIVSDNRNYKRCIGYNFDVITTSRRTQEEATEWGVAPDGTYYLPPLGSQKYFPVASSSWQSMSIWFNFDEFFDKYTEEAGRSDFILRDSYPLASVISVLLAQFSTIKHEATEEYSRFLYGSYNPISYQAFTILLSPKSNVLHGNYDQPAQKAETTLNTMLKMLRDVFRCYWFIEDGKLKIEHISWFRNGGSYGTSPVVGTDLTKLRNVRHGKPWGYLSSSYEFDKEEMAERYEFSWMDEVTEGFDGYPIEIQSAFVTDGKTEDVSLSQFTTDIDYMMLNTSAISEDGFALFAAVWKDDHYELPIIERKIDGAQLRLQNGYLSWVVLQPNFYVYDLPAKKVKINNADMTLSQTSRKRKQTVKFPTVEQIDTEKLVKTFIGNGEIEKITVNLSSRLNEITLKYDTEQ